MKCFSYKEIYPLPEGETKYHEITLLMFANDLVN